MLSAVKALLCKINHAKNLHLGAVVAFQTSEAGKKVIAPLNW
jgi:hypothetical protein